jgi:DNA-binding PadR family transcriptional regulator
VGSDRSSPPLTASGFLVLLALASGATHGYAIMRFAEQISGETIKLGPGTLYRTISRLLADGLVEETNEGDPTAPHDSRRRYYRLTMLGNDAARAEAELLTRMVAAARVAGLVEEESEA